MAEDRKTIQYKLKSGRHTLELREYLTGREKRAIKNALWQGKTMKIKDGKGESDEIQMDQMDASTDRTIELMVVSIDGSKEKILDQVLDFRSDDYDDLLEKIEELTGPVADEKKEDGPNSTKS